MKEVVGCFLSECSDAERTKVNTDFVSYCLSITNPPIPSSVSQLALSTATTSAPKAAGADPIQTYTSLQDQANPSETSSANAANAAKGMVMSPRNVDISRTAVVATVALAALVMSVGLMGSCM
ncbi:hypothetical protein FFLO_06047 [Filobasidium floriforme]|uniref:Uncharacterized protein n=1 Tax=Filobasidium floriforme TaxID=5210 RepID=A0A8K0JFW7_9TREE|nr:uncharacterized protein HD553DRAFT_334374 [Filobasidium floriforme]KAG7528624.1 hypothetical protein FFLO_06047 [Filobasidium floriforme]KAH8087288.1 hypothetical protein HD553DRAFT_334374 [Filobasidium floriforme]